MQALLHLKQELLLVRASLLPEELTSVSDIKSQLKDMLKEQKRSSLVVVAEGDETGGALKLAEKIKDDFTKYDLRVYSGAYSAGWCSIGTGSSLGKQARASAIKVLMEGHNEVMVEWLIMH